VAGSNITLTPSGSTITIASTGSGPGSAIGDADESPLASKSIASKSSGVLKLQGIDATPSAFAVGDSLVSVKTGSVPETVKRAVSGTQYQVLQLINSAGTQMGFDWVRFSY
jgi:hypothetical protein